MKTLPAGPRPGRLWGRWLIAAALALMLVAGPASGVAFAQSRYTVQPGDTLTSIAARYGTSVDAIVAANNLPNRSTIYAGQSLVIPTGGSSAPASQPPQQATGTYTVQPGDTLSGIAARYGTTVQALAQANGLTSTTIRAGQVLKIVPPNAPAQPAQPQTGASTYVVRSGDSLSSVAAQLGVSRFDLASANGLAPSSFLYVGQVLVIPGSTPAQPEQPAQPMPTGAPAVQPTTTPVPVQSAPQAEAGKPVKYVVQRGDTLSGIAARFDTTVEALRRLNNLQDTNLLHAGQELVIVKGDTQSGPADATPTPRPQPTIPMGKFGPKWVDVDLSTQTMTAYEGQVPVYTSKMSSGLPRYPTVEGTYRVYARYVQTRMKGGEGADYYNIPDVPYTLYFYSGYALHGAYWHDSFGTPQSHGCVNLPVDAAKWVFEWAPIGTMVVSHK
jgi:LysM repeat protein